MLYVPTDEDEDDDNIEIDTNEEVPECSVTGGGDELTNLENDLDSTGNLNNGYFVYFAWLTLHHHKYWCAASLCHNFIPLCLFRSFKP